jgi:hypothetical protein
MMKLNFFYVESDRVRQAAQRRVVGAWERRRRWDKSPGTHDLKLITIVCDDSLHPVHVYLLTLSLRDGWITEESRRDAVALVVDEARWGGGNKKRRAAWIASLKKHVQGMPSDMGGQLATALDVPLWELMKTPLAVGGPLPLSLQMECGVQELLLYFEPAEAIAE